MMQEVETGVQEVTGKLEETQIADQLQDAALTDVTQAISEKKEETPPRNTVAPAPQAGSPVSLPAAQVISPVSSPTAQAISPMSSPPQPTLGGSPLAPPTAGFVPSPGLVSTTPVKAFAPVTPTTPPMKHTMVYTASSPQPPVISGGAQNPVVPAPVYVPSTQTTIPQTLTETSSTSTLVASSSIDLDDAASTIGPVYPAPGETKQAGFFGWLPGRNIVSKVVQKTKSSMESVITTLDPGMKEVIYSGGDVDIVVTSSKDVKVCAVRQAFQEVFGRATVTGQDSQPQIAPQPVGYSAGLKGAEERIDNLLRSEAIDSKQATVSIESFIEEILPDRWYDISCIVLKDPANNIQLEVFSQATPVPSDYIELAKEQTSSDYSLRWSGLAITIGQVINQQLPTVAPGDWHLHFTGISRQQMLYLACKSLAGLYKQRLSYTVPGSLS